MGVKINDGVRKQIVAAFVQCENYSEVARQFGLSSNGVKKIVQGSSDCANVFNEKKEQNTKEVLEYLDGQKERVCGILDKILIELSKSEKLEKAQVQHLTTAMGTLIDKYALINDKRKDTLKESKKPVSIVFKFEEADNDGSEL